MSMARYITVDGRTLSITEWLDIIPVTRNMIHYWLHHHGEPYAIEQISEYLNHKKTSKADRPTDLTSARDVANAAAAAGMTYGQYVALLDCRG